MSDSSCSDGAFGKLVFRAAGSDVVFVVQREWLNDMLSSVGEHGQGKMA